MPNVIRFFGGNYGAGGVGLWLLRFGLRRLFDDPSDGRGSVVSLTDAGRELHEQVFRAYLDATQDLLDPMSETELKDTDGTLMRLLALFEGEALP